MNGPRSVSSVPPRLSGAVLAAGVVLVAINLRPAAASIGPVLDRIESSTGLSSGWAGALTTLPVLCFGLLAPLAPALARRFGVQASLAGALCVLLAGMLMRLIPGVGFLFLGTAVAGRRSRPATCCCRSWSGATSRIGPGPRWRCTRSR